MSDLQQQLAELRRRVRKIERKYAGGLSIRASEHIAETSALPRPAHRYVEEWLSGEEVETAFGKHFETERIFERHRRHGSADIGALADLPRDILGSFEIPDAAPAEWAFLDTETTGLTAGTCAFLVGVGRITAEGFKIRQFFMRDPDEEASLLDRLARYLQPFRVLITYNGRAYDQPLLETRYRLNRARPPFSRLDHLDLLFSARRLWKLRFDRCRLVDLENQVLGVEREGDVPGALIPYLYFEYLRTRQAARMLPVFHHNQIDILTLACLTAVVPLAFRSAEALTNGAEMAGVARWLREAGELERSRDLFRRAIDAGLPDELLFCTMRDVAVLERRLGGSAVAMWNDLASAKNPFRVQALEELAKHWEHGEKDYARALDVTRSALEIEDSRELRRREQRLLRRVAQSSAPARPRRRKSIQSKDA